MFAPETSLPSGSKHRLEEVFCRLPFFTAVLCVIACAFLARVIVWPARWALDTLLDPWSAPPLQGAGIFRLVGSALVLAPLVETLVCQTFVFRCATKLGMLPRHLWPTLAASAAIFGVMHVYSAGYVLSSTAVGFVFAAAFALAGARHRAYWIVVVAHAGLNTVPMFASLSPK